MQEEEDERSPLEIAEEKADALGLDGDDRDDFIEARMKRAGFRRGPGNWISEEEDESDNDDDDQPMTRGDWRRMQRERRKKSVQSPPRKPKNQNEDDGKNAGKSRGKRDPWW